MTERTPPPRRDRPSPPSPPRAGTGSPRPSGSVRRWSQTAGAFDLAVCLVYVCFAAWLTHGLWPSPSTRAIAENVNDQALIEWFLAHGVLFWTGDFSLVTDRLNAPDGVNLMSNASHIVHGVLFAPVTVLFGAADDVRAAHGAEPGRDGRRLVPAARPHPRPAAAARPLLGGAFAGFAPGMISQSNSHLHMTAQWLVPADRLVRHPADPGASRPRQIVADRRRPRPARRASSSSSARRCCSSPRSRWSCSPLVYAVDPPRLGPPGPARVRRPACCLAAGVAIALLAYPLWAQFAGPSTRRTRRSRPQFFYADLAELRRCSRRCRWPGRPRTASWPPAPTEYNTFLGLPLLLVAARLCDLAAPVAGHVRPLLVSGIVMALLSLGPYVTLNGERTGWPSFYNMIAEVPVIDGALPTRFALALIPLIARAARARHGRRDPGGPGGPGRRAGR